MLRTLLGAKVYAVLPGLLTAVPAVAALGYPQNPVLGPIDLCLPAVMLAILVEGAVVLVLARFRKRPGRRLLLACALVNVITVTALALAVELRWADTLAGLAVAELLIWLAEAAFLRYFPGTGIGWKEGLSFSLAMNLASLLAGAGLVAATWKAAA